LCLERWFKHLVPPSEEPCCTPGPDAWRSPFRWQRWPPARVSGGRTPLALRSDARYIVTTGQASRQIEVEVELSVAPAQLLMSPSAPMTLSDGWATFVHDLRLRTPTGDEIAVNANGAGGWTVSRPGAPNVTLRYRVQLQHDDTLPNGEPRWIRDRTMSEVGYAKDWGIFLTAAPALVIPDSVGNATLELRAPEGWAVATSWPAVAGARSADPRSALRRPASSGRSRSRSSISCASWAPSRTRRPASRSGPCSSSSPKTRARIAWAAGSPEATSLCSYLPTRDGKSSKAVFARYVEGTEALPAAACGVAKG